MNHRQNIQRLAALALLVASAANAATLLTADDKTVTGELKSFEDGAFIIEPRAGETTKVPLADIVQVTLTWQERISAAPKAPTANPKSPATQAKSAPRWKLELANGDRLTASLKTWNDNSISFSAATLEESDVTVPLDQLQAMWTPAEQLAFKARTIGTPAAGVDVAYVEKDGDVKAVTGQVIGADEEFLRFKWEGEERKIRLERLVGLVLSHREQPPAISRDPFELFTLSTGELLSGKLAGFEKGDNGAAFLVKPIGTSNAPTFRIPVGKLEKIIAKNGAVVWLTDLTPSAVLQTPYFDRVIPYRIDKNLSGGKLALTDGPVERGIAVHSRCFLTYDIGGAGGEFETFRVKVGFQQDDGKLGRAAVRVVADDKILWQDPDLKGPARPAVLNLDIKGVKTLRLEVDYGKEQDVGDQIIWADPKLVRAKK